ncbi:CheR family methyltransferase [Spirulina major]|uniref:CheR family methyltransferase n=1 Tax=Spirulina major TaxID=270636 RepID=UPI000933C3DD|nr:protein-glutamate O-methyltransferase CheR [Spirulina major]
MFDSPPRLTDTTFVILRDLIRRQIGIYFDPSKRDILADKLLPRLEHCRVWSFLDYYYHLKYDAHAQAEWQMLADVLSVPETFFWREADALRLLTDVIVPHHYHSHSGRCLSPLRIWSAACATGEEPLSIAIALAEAGWFDKLPIQIYGTDISARAIHQAKAGIYRDRAFRQLSFTLKHKYFQPVAPGWCIDETIHQRIHWDTANLLDQAAIQPYVCASVIFCRNLFIYFSLPTIQTVIDQFYCAMPSPAYLFVSSSESLLKVNTPFRLTSIQDTFVYAKP